MTEPTPLDPTKPYMLKFEPGAGLSPAQAQTVYMRCMPGGAIYHLGVGEFQALQAAGVPLVNGGKDPSQWKAVDQQAWASRGYVNRPGE